MQREIENKFKALVEDDIIKLIDVCTLEKSDETFIRNISVTPEKVLHNYNKAISRPEIKPTNNIGPCFVTITT